MKFYYLKALMLCLFLSSLNIYAQLPGFINRQATSAAGRLVLDPNGDGYTSTTTAGFGNNDVTNSELLYTGIRAYSNEPFGDLERGANQGATDFVPDSSGNCVYHRFSAAQNVMFRMRLGSITQGSKGYSIMMDTDSKFGATGPNADPNYLPSTTGVNGNPGFEIEIVLETNFRIAIYNVDGTSTPVLVKQYINWQDMSQISIASSNNNGDPDFLIDFYIPFSDLQAAPFNLTTSSPIRMTATSVMGPKPAIGGPRSDIYGTPGDTYEDFILGQPACNIFSNPVTCPTTMCTAAPIVNTPINTGTVNISGTWTKSALPGAAGTTTITVYKNGSSIGTVPGVSSGSTWSLNSIILVNGDVITARSQATGESMCLTSNAVPASTCNISNRPATPILTCTSGSKGLDGTNLSTGWRVHVDNLTRNVLNDNVTNTGGLFGAQSGTSPNITWLFSGGCGSGAPLTSGSYKVYYVNTTTGCVSDPAYFCAPGNGGTSLAGSLAVPVITTPANSVFTTATTSITGTTDANASLMLYINRTMVQTVTANGTGVFTFTGLNLLAGQQLYIVTELNTGTVSTSKCANQTAVFTVTCFTQVPAINSDNNSQLTAGAPITGTSTEPAGTTIRVYTSTNTLVATTTVQSNGTWSTGNAGTLPAIFNAVAATSYYANAQNGTCGISGNTASYPAAAATSSGRCGTITGTIGSGASSVSGTLTGSFTTTTVNLYLDGELIGSANTTGTAWGPIPVNTTPTNTLYPNGVLQIGIQETGKQEVACPASAQRIACTPTPVAPVYSLSSTNVNQNQTITCTITNAVTGTFYALADSASGASFGVGKWATSNGNLVLTTSAFSSAGTYKVKVTATSLTGLSVCAAVSATTTIIVNPVVLPLKLIEFKGKKLSENVLLEWKTENEVGVSRFEIERSENAHYYTRIGTVNASGNNAGTSAYSFVDAAPAAANNYYRLKMIDFDGKVSYSHIVVIYANPARQFVVENIKPNPFTDYVSAGVWLQQPQQITIQITDLSGKTVFTKFIAGSSGANILTCDGLSGLGSGVYFMKIIAGADVFQQKILKMH